MMTALMPTQGQQNADVHRMKLPFGALMKWSLTIRLRSALHSMLFPCCILQSPAPRSADECLASKLVHQNAYVYVPSTRLMRVGSRIARVVAGSPCLAVFMGMVLIAWPAMHLELVSVIADIRRSIWPFLASILCTTGCCFLCPAVLVVLAAGCYRLPRVLQVCVQFMAAARESCWHEMCPCIAPLSWATGCESIAQNGFHIVQTLKPWLRPIKVWTSTISLHLEIQVELASSK